MKRTLLFLACILINFLLQAQYNTGIIKYRVPVVVHVCYTNVQNNPPDAELIQMITRLNEFFQGRTDYTAVPQPFQSRIADCQLEFVLATRTPGGEQTTGIIRKPASKDVFRMEARDATNEVALWDRSKYLNIILVPSLDKLSGYAPVPVLNPVTGIMQMPDEKNDAVVINAAHFLIQTTLAHEVGHWLGLPHTFGNALYYGAPCSDDGFSDTPPAAFPKIPSEPCSSFPYRTTCNDERNGEMVTNMMYYSTCTRQFTPQQKSAMQQILGPGGARSSISLTANALTIPTPEMAAVWMDNFYGGPDASLRPGAYTEAAMNARGIPSNWISSAKVQPGYQLELYSGPNCDGAVRRLGYDVPSLPGFNDITRSIIVREAGATLYSECGFSGYRDGRTPGRWQVADFDGVGNDVLSSLKVRPGYRVRLFENNGFTGRNINLTADAFCLGDAAVNFNNITSSMIVEKLPVSSDVLQIFSDINYNIGSSLPSMGIGLAPGSYTYADLKAAGMNDWYPVSFKIRPGYKVTMYTSSNFNPAWASKTFYADVPSLNGPDGAALIYDAPGGFPQISSIKVELTSQYLTAVLFDGCPYSNAYSKAILYEGIWNSANTNTASFQISNTSAVQLPSGFVAVLCDQPDFYSTTATRLMLTESVPCLTSVVYPVQAGTTTQLYNWNDRLKAIYAYRPAALFNAACPVSGQGSAQYPFYPIPEGSFTATQLKAFGCTVQELSAVRPAPGYLVRLFKQDNFKGDSVDYTMNMDCLVDEMRFGGGWNDGVRSARIMKAPLNSNDVVTTTVATGMLTSQNTAQAVPVMSTSKNISQDIPGRSTSNITAQQAGELQLLPNPANSEVRLQYQSAAVGKALVTLYTAMGAPVASYNTYTAAGANSLTIPLGNLAAGLYMIELKMPGNATRVVKLTVQH